MDYIFDVTYFRSSGLCRDVGDLFSVYDKVTGKFLGYRAVTKRLINNKEICSASFPREANDLTTEERSCATRVDKILRV